MCRPVNGLVLRRSQEPPIRQPRPAGLGLSGLGPPHPDPAQERPETCGHSPSVPTHTPFSTCVSSSCVQTCLQTWAALGYDTQQTWSSLWTTSASSLTRMMSTPAHVPVTTERQEENMDSTQAWGQCEHTPQTPHRPEHSVNTHLRLHTGLKAP